MIISWKWTTAWTLNVSLPFSVLWNTSYVSWFICATNTNPATSWRWWPTLSVASVYFTKRSQNATLQWSDVAVNDEISLMVTCELS
jgi:hypothetical protein